jgi:hypothetical protein
MRASVDITSFSPLTSAVSVRDGRSVGVNSCCVGSLAHGADMNLAPSLQDQSSLALRWYSSAVARRMRSSTAATALRAQSEVV